MRKVRSEKDEFEQGLQKYYAVRSVFSNLSNNLLATRPDALRDETRRTPRGDARRGLFLRAARAMKGFFQHLRGNLRKSTDEIYEISKMLDAMYKRFHRRARPPQAGCPHRLLTLRYEKEIERLEEAFNSQFNTADHRHHREAHLTQKFFETVAVVRPAHLRVA
jgi:hypothetical protein